MEEQLEKFQKERNTLLERLDAINSAIEVLQGVNKHKNEDENPWLSINY